MIKFETREVRGMARIALCEDADKDAEEVTALLDEYMEQAIQELKEETAC